MRGGAVRSPAPASSRMRRVSDLSASSEGTAPRRGWLTRGVVGVGAASFFSDAGHEIATSLLPSFVTSTLRGSAAALGVIEGVSDALTGVAKFVAGPLANDETRRVRLATGGYLVTAAATGAIGAATAVWQVGMLRATAWVARGARTPARDSLLASLALREAYGRAFGLERAGDNLGAVAGPLAAAGLVAVLGIRPSIYFAAIPGVFAALAITFAAREARRSGEPVRRRYELGLRRMHEAGLTPALTPVVLFELGNCATTLLILRATMLLTHGGRDVTAATSVAVLIYAAHNLFGAGVAYAGGHWIDRAGPRRVFAAGAVLFALAYAGFAADEHAWPVLLLFFVLAGSGIGLAETAESTLVARLLPDELRGSGFGVLGGIQSLGDFASSGAVGVIWAVVSPTAAFLYAAAWMVAAAAVTATGFRQSSPTG
jgi:MFS family permease